MPLDPLETIPFRPRAEQIAAQQLPAIEHLSLDQMRALTQELQVHQVELELQNDELRRVSDELSRSQRQFYGLFNLAPVGYLVLDEAGIIQEVNQTFCSLAGRERGQVIYRPFSEFIAVSDRAVFLSRFRAFYRSPADKRLMLRLLNRTDFFHARLEGALISAAWDQPAAEEAPQLLLTVSNISDQVQAEEALQRSEERFQQLADHIEEIFWLSDSAHRILYVSPAYQAVWGRAAQELYERPRAFLDYVHPDDRGKVSQIYPRVAQTRQPDQLEFRILRPDGEVRWLWARSFPVLDPDGRVSRIAGVAADITTRKQAEDDLRGSLEENRMLLRELEGRVSKSLQLIAGIVGIETQQFGHPAVNQALAGVGRRVQMLSDLYNELYRNGNLHEVNLQQYFEHIISSLGTAVGTSTGRREIVLHCQPIQVEADLAAGLGLILNELVTNALKHAFSGEQAGRVHAELRQDGARLALAVQDNGRGLPDVLNEAAPVGVGLQLVQWLAGQMKGTFSISARQPARFQVEIPFR